MPRIRLFLKFDIRQLLSVCGVAAAFILFAANTQAQRCGGDVTYIVRDRKGKIIDAEKVKVSDVKFNSGALPGVSYKKTFLSDAKSPKALNFRTGCGLELIEATLNYRGQMMRLRLHRLPAEVNFFIDSVPFRQSDYEIFFNRGFDLTGQKLNREGIKTQRNNYILRETAESGLLVAAENWSKTVFDKNNQ